MTKKADPNTVYIVSGFMRSGTSMMMLALQGGGMIADFDPARDNRLNNRFADGNYNPNEGGFFELSRKSYKDPDFPLRYRGLLIKALFGAMAGLPGHLGLKYKIAYMLRDPEEIRQSYEAFFRRGAPAAHRHYEPLMEKVQGILTQRRDVTLTPLQYREVVDNPLDAFEHLALVGWPIEPEAAASVVNPDLCRFRLEDLEVGI